MTTIFTFQAEMIIMINSKHLKLTHVMAELRSAIECLGQVLQSLNPCYRPQDREDSSHFPHSIQFVF